MVSITRLCSIMLATHSQFKDSWKWDVANPLNLSSPLPSLPCFPSSRMALPLWPLPSSRATTRWFLSCWRTILKARSAFLPCTLLPARTTPSQLPCSSRMTTTLMSSRRYSHSTVWPWRVGMCRSQANVVLCVCAFILWLWGFLWSLWIIWSCNGFG